KLVVQSELLSLQIIEVDIEAATEAEIDARGLERELSLAMARPPLRQFEAIVVIVQMAGQVANSQRKEARLDGSAAGIDLDFHFLEDAGFRLRSLHAQRSLHLGLEIQMATKLKLLPGVGQRRIRPKGAA